MLALALVTACSEPPSVPLELAHYPLNSLKGVLSQRDIEYDPIRSVDGKGSVRILATTARRVRLFTTGDVDVEAARLFYRAELRSEDLEGTAYLEMRCHFPGEGVYFSRALDAPLEGPTEWVPQQTVFFLNPGENPDEIELNLIIDGTGTVWIDDIHLTQLPLH